MVSVEEDGLYTVQWPDDPCQRPPDSGDQQAGIAAGDLRAADNIVSAGETQVRDGYTARAPRDAATPPVRGVVQGATPGLGRACL